MELPVRVELTTFRLQGGCSAIELWKHDVSLLILYFDVRLSGVDYHQGRVSLGERRFSILRAASTVPICFVNPLTLDGAYDTWFSVDFRTGRGGRARTYECESQSLVPYHLATPLCYTHLNTPFSVCQVFVAIFCVAFEIKFPLGLYS